MVQISKQPQPFYSSDIQTGQLSVDITAIPIPITGIRGLTITSNSTNGQNIYFGLAGVTNLTGDVLFPGQSATIDGRDNTKKLYVVADAGTQKLFYSGII